MNKPFTAPDFFVKPENWKRWRDTYGYSDVLIEDIEFQNIDFSDLDFSNVKFINCHFENAIFKSANLISTDLTGSSFTGCDFFQAKLIASNLSRAKFTACVFKQANLLTAVLDKTIFINCDLTDLDLQTFNLSEICFDFCDLSKQNLAGKDLTRASLKKANLKGADLTNTIFNHANLAGINLERVKLNKTYFKFSNLSNVDLSGFDLFGINFFAANLENVDFRNADLTRSCLGQTNLSGIKLFNTKIEEWDIRHAKCSHAYWDQFERVYSKSLIIELKYDYRLTSNEIATLPILIEHLQAAYWGITIRLDSIKNISGIALVKLIVEETDKYELDELEDLLNKEVQRIQKAQLALRTEHKIQAQLKEAIASFKEKFWPRLLELAIEQELKEEKRFCVLFIDLHDFSRWNKESVSEKLSLFRGLLKPVLERWKAGYPNMEGDSLRATFLTAKSAVECAFMIREVLIAADFKLRIGIDFGHISVVHNEVTERSDLEGAAVNMAARLESIADVGQIVVSEKVKRYTEKETQSFIFQPKSCQLKKSIGNKQAGDWINIYLLGKK